MRRIDGMTRAFEAIVCPDWATVNQTMGLYRRVVLERDTEQGRDQLLERIIVPPGRASGTRGPDPSREVRRIIRGLRARVDVDPLLQVFERQGAV